MASLVSGPAAEARPAAGPSVRPLGVEIAFYVLIGLVIIGPILNAANDMPTGEGNPVRQLSYIALFFLLIVATAPAGGPPRALSLSQPVNLLLAWCWASLSWAIEPGIAGRRLILTTVVIYSVFIAITSIGADRMLRGLRRALVPVLVLNFAIVILAPQIGIHQFDPKGDPSLVGDWKGFLPEKNLAGSIAAIAIILLFFQRQSTAKLIRWGLLAANVYFLVRTGSKTSMGIVALSLSLGLVYMRYNHRFWPLVLPTIALLLLSAVLAVYIQWDALVGVLDRPDAFTGRTQIWSALLAYLRDHWVLGTGYGSFWNIGTASPIFTYARSGDGAWLTKIASGHNGYLDLTTQIGIPGLCLAVFALFFHPIGKLLITPNLGRDGAAIMAMIVFCLGHNFTESTLLDRDQFVQFCLIVAVAAVGQATRRQDSSLRENGSDAAMNLRKAAPVEGA